MIRNALTSLSPHPGHLLNSAQVTFDNAGFRYAFIATVIVVIGIVTLVVVRTFFRNSASGDSVELDLDFLDKVGDSKKLTPDEMKKVRDAMVRRALAKKQDKPGSSTMSDLMRIASGLESPDVAGPAETPEPTRAAPARQTPEPAASQETATPPGPAGGDENPDEADDDSEKPVGLEALLEKGIITRKEYDQLTRRQPRQN